LPEDIAVKLHFVTLGGFKKPDLNEEFLEGPTAEFWIGGRETYWQASGKYLLYFCQRYQKWRVAGIDAFSAIKNGECFAFASDAIHSRDIRNNTFLKSWIEVESGKWQHRSEAGVVALGTLADQLAVLDEANKSSAEEADGECEADVDEDVTPTDDTFGKRKKPECPLKPAMRKAHAAVRAAVKAAGAWVRRLFPSLLPAPVEQNCTWQLTGAKQFCTNHIEVANDAGFAECQQMVLDDEQCENVMYSNSRTTKCFCVPKGEACNVSSKASAKVFTCVPQRSAPEQQQQQQQQEPKS